MRLLAIDPGPEKSAAVLYHTDSKAIKPLGIWPNHHLREWVGNQLLQSAPVEHLAIEMIACYGMPVGKSIFETCVWVGRFLEAWGGPYNLVLRRGRWGPGPDITGAEGAFSGVCMTLCRNNTAKDKNVRRAILDRFPGTGGGATPQVGIKKQPGPLYGVSKDLWAAIGVAVTWAEHHA